MADLQDKNDDLVDNSISLFTNRYVTGVSNGGTSDVIVVTDSSNKVHLRLDVKTLLGGTLEVREAVTASSNGTALTVYNRNRASSFVGTALWYHTPTITGTGTLLLTHLMSGAGGIIQPSNFNEDFKLILKVSTKYLFRFTSSAGSNGWSFIPNWYEAP